MTEPSMIQTGAVKPTLRLRLRLPPRALWLPALAALIGAGMAGSALLQRSPAQASVVPAGYVALVNNKGILLSDYMTQTGSETGQDFSQAPPADRAKVLREMIDEELLVQRALALDLPETTTEVREAMASGVNSQAAAPLLAIEPSEQQLRAFYLAHTAEYATAGLMTVHDLVLHVGGYQNADQSTAQAETDANEAVYQLRAGATIDYVMEHFGLADSGRVDNGEQLDFAAKLHLGDKLYRIAAGLGDGEISDPIEDSDGVHILVMDRRIAPRVAEFDTVRDKVYNAFRQAQSKRAAEDNLAVLRRQAKILVAPGQNE